MDSVISAIVSPIINSICTPLFQQFGYLFNAGANVRDLKAKISKDLNLTKEEVQEQIVTDTAASDEVVPRKRVKEWMKEVQSMEEVMTNIDEDYNHRKMCLAGCPINCWSSYRIGKRAAKVALEAKELIRERKSFDVLTKKAAPAIRRILSLPEITTASTELYVRKAFSYLQDEEVGMIGIWGMGGVGKTTLLQRINNHPSVEAAEFDYVIWVVASQDLNHDQLQKDVAERVGHTLEATSTRESKAQALYRYLKMKSFLLLLDDIWEPMDIGKLGIPCPIATDGVVPKRKVVFTTRSEAVCDQMTSYQKFQVRCKKIKIECLKPKEAWELFLGTFGEGMRSIISSDNRVRSRAEKVADKCGGLPLALVVIAQAMSANKTWQEWEVAVISLNKMGIQEMGSKDADPFPLLKTSYDHLSNESIKLCFLSCALWPEDHEIFEPDLINFWLGLNLINDGESYINNCNKGDANIQILKRACLLEDANSPRGDCVKMHDIIRGMALWIISDSKKRWMVINRGKLKAATEDAMEWKEAEVISLMYGRSGTLPEHPNCPNLSSLMLQRNSINLIPEDFFQNMHALTFLDLSCNPINEVPPAIGRLIRLRHLDLSETAICSLPVELGDLTELKYLSLFNTNHLRSIPRGLISRLQKLEQLFLGNTSFDGWDTKGQASIGELVCSKITSLGFDFRKLDTIEQLAKNEFVSLWTIIMRKLEAVTSLPLQPLLLIGETRCTVFQLIIRDCESLEEILVSSRSDEEFDNLELFELDNLPALEKITLDAGVVPASLLRNIRYLNILSCAKLKNVTWIKHLPYLESLIIIGCYGMEHVIGNEEGGDEVSPETNEQENLMEFSKLRRLVLKNLPELRAFSMRDVALPSLKAPLIRRCPRFEGLRQSSQLSE